MNLRITDVTLRDGLQMESKLIPTQDKAKLFELLLQLPFERLEITSFVSPKWVPQFSDSEDFIKRVLPLLSKKEVMAFVPNEKGLARLLQFPIPWASCFIAASETFNRKNVNASVEETLCELSHLVQNIRKAGRRIRVYVSTVFGCPYEGSISNSQLFAILDEVAGLQPDEIALGDTIGVAEPKQVETIVNYFSGVYPREQTALHFHNTYGLALSCVSAAVDVGISHFDGTTGGIGGCPYAKGATGNVAVEEMLYLFFRQGTLQSFPLSEIQAVHDLVGKQWGLTLHSQIHEISLRGGTIYGGR